MRISFDDWGLQLAHVTAERSTCVRRSVGCVLTDRYRRILATGYNGVASGQPHCNERVAGCAGLFADAGLLEKRIAWPNACPGADSPSGTDLGGCQAIHAEQNAMLQCRDPTAVEHCFVTVSPCIHCVKMLMNTACKRLVFSELYSGHEACEQLWQSQGREWILRPLAS